MNEWTNEWMNDYILIDRAVPDILIETAAVKLKTMNEWMYIDYIPISRAVLWKKTVKQIHKYKKGYRQGDNLFLSKSESEMQY